MVKISDRIATFIFMVVGQVEAHYRNLSALRVVRSDSLYFILFYWVRMLICADGMMMATGWAH